MSMVLLSCAAIFTGVVAWLSQGAIAFAEPGHSRIATLPLTGGSLALAVTAGAAVAGLRWAGASLAPLAVLGLALLPWLPFPTPLAFLLWTAPLVSVVWLATGLAMLASIRWSLRLPRVPGPVSAGVLACLVYAFAAWSVAPARPGGDEPHYLIITQSLITDGDLRIENNHRRGDYRAYFPRDLSKPDYLRRGRDGQIYSIHAPGLSALVSPAFGVAGYRGVVVFLLVLSSLAAALAWHLARQVTGRDDAAWFGWASVVLAPTLLLNAFTVYPDGPAALVVLTGMWALIRVQQERSTHAESAWPWFLHGAALAMLPWLHTRFALLAGGFGALVLLDLAGTRNAAAKASAFLAIPAVSAMGWVGYFIAIYGSPDPAIPYRGSDLGSPAYILGGTGGILFDQIYGLITHGPVLAVAGCGVAAMVWQRGPSRRLALRLLFVALPYTITVTHFAMWWGGFSTPARFLLPLLPALAVPAAAAWQLAPRRGTRATMLAALTTTACISLVLATVDRGRLAYVLRDSVYALWIQWTNRTIDLSHGLPAFFARVQRGRPGWLFFVESAVWVAAAVVGWLIIRAADRHAWFQSRARLATATALTYAVAAMTAVSIVWTLEHVSGEDRAGSAMSVLRNAAGSRSFQVDLTAWSRIRPADLPARLRLTLPAAADASARLDRPLFVLPQVPAGEYRLRVVRTSGPGWLMVGIARDQFALVTQPVELFDREVRLSLPVDVPSLVVRGDEGARLHVRSLIVEPLSVRSGDEKVSGSVARRAVRYGTAMVFFLDDRSFPEPSGFWVAGGQQTRVVVQPDPVRDSSELWIRNAPVENHVVIRNAGWREDLRLAPGEERRMRVPIDPKRGAAMIELDVVSGFQPSASDPASRDDRFLGVWVTVSDGR